MKSIVNYKRIGDKPFLIMMCGLPGSGKSTFAENSITVTSGVRQYKPVIHSSDGLRKEIYGNESTQGDANKVFGELHKRIKNDLIAGKDVIYDATCIKKKQRIQFLKELKNISCTPVCICMATEYSLCLYNNEHRERKVPVDVIKRMQMNWQPPHYNEGFEQITYIFSYLDKNYNIVNASQKDKYNLGKFFEIANSFDQENHHHQLTLGKHCENAGQRIQRTSPDNFWLLIATLLHDNGKLYTKTKTNTRGIEDGDYHYYQHHCVGSYNVMFYLHSFDDIKETNIAYVTNLIYYHMHPYNAWKQSERVHNKDKLLLGEKLYNDIQLLHEADLLAH